MFGPGHITPGVSEASDEIFSLGLEIAGSRWAVASQVQNSHLEFAAQLDWHGVLMNIGRYHINNRGE